MVLSVLHIHAAYCGAAGRHPGRGCHGAVLLAGVPHLRTGQPAAGAVPYLIREKDTGVSLYPPGTGAWTGALVAAVRRMRIWQAFLVITVGVLVSGFITGGIAYGLFTALA